MGFRLIVPNPDKDIVLPEANLPLGGNLAPLAGFFTTSNTCDLGTSQQSSNMP